MTHNHKSVTYDSYNDGADIIGTAIDLYILSFGIFFQN